MKTFKGNARKATELLLALIPRIAAEDWADTQAELQVRVHYQGLSKGRVLQTVSFY